MAAYEAAVRLRPVEGRLRVELAELYGRIGRWDQALEQYREVLARQPDDEAASRGLALAGARSAGKASP